MATVGKLWTKPELMLAVELYCRTPFGQIDQSNPNVIALAGQLGRTPGSVSMKMANLASLDETLDRKGLEGSSRLDREVWSDFFAAPVDFLDRVEQMRSGEYSARTPTRTQFELREGGDYLYEAKGRRNQDFFRRLVLTAYDNRCAITGIANEELLVASHIVPWAENVTLRTMPTNGVCLNALHDRAFDRYLISVEGDLTVIVSKRLKLTPENRPFFEGRRLTPPTRFMPDTACLATHRERMWQLDKAA